MKLQKFLSEGWQAMLVTEHSPALLLTHCAGRPHNSVKSQ